MPPKKSGKSKSPAKTKSAESKPKNGRSKKGKKGKKGKKQKVDKNLLYCDDKHFDPNLAIVTVEHCLKCPIYREMAEKIFGDICAAFPEVKFKLIRNDFDRLEAREGAFEVSLAKNCRLPSELLWSGVDRGPPRREKIPSDITTFIPIIKKLLNLEDNTLAFLKTTYTYDVCVSFLPWGAFRCVRSLWDRLVPIRGEPFPLRRESASD